MPLDWSVKPAWILCPFPTFPRSPRLRSQSEGHAKSQ